MVVGGSSLWDDVYASSEMMGSVEMLREFSSPFAGLALRAVGLGCEGLVTHLLNKRVIAYEYLVYHFPPAQTAAQPETSTRIETSNSLSVCR